MSSSKRERTYEELNQAYKEKLKALMQQEDELMKLEKYVEDLEKENKGLKRFYDYWSELYGKGLEVANWHMNGDLEPFDSFFDSAEEELESDN